MQIRKYSFAGLLPLAAVLLLCGCPNEKAKTHTDSRLKAILDNAGCPSTAEELRAMAPKPSATAELQRLLTRSYNYPPGGDDLEALDALLTIAADTPRAALQRNWDNGVEMQYPAALAIRNAAALNVERTRKALANRQYRGLRVYLEQFYNLGSWCYDDPLLLSTLTGFVCDEILFDILQASLEKLDAGDLRSFAGRFDYREASLKKATKTALTFDSVMMYISFCRLGGTAAGRAELYRQLTGGSPDRKPGKEELALLDDLIPSCMELETSAARYAAMDEFERHGVMLQLCREFPDAAQLLPINKLFVRQTEVIAKLRCLKAATEAELHRRKYGDYPAEIPGIDPFTGEPLQYVKGEKIYSVGPDLIDGDNGRHGNDPDDIVFRLSAGDGSK